MSLTSTLALDIPVRPMDAKRLISSLKKKKKIKNTPNLSLLHKNLSKVAIKKFFFFRNCIATTTNFHFHVLQIPSKEVNHFWQDDNPKHTNLLAIPMTVYYYRCMYVRWP